MPFVVALIIIGVLLAYTFVAAAREPGVGPGETAVAYQTAWHRRDLSTLYDLSADSMRAGRSRAEFECDEKCRFDEGPLPGGRGAAFGVESVVQRELDATVVTRAVSGDAAMRSEMTLVRGNGRWQVVGCTGDAAATHPGAQ